MREALKTNISKYGPKTSAAMTVENVQGKGLQLVVIYAGRKHYLPLSSVPMNADTHANHANHQKINVDHNGKVSIAGSLVGTRLAVTSIGHTTSETTVKDNLNITGKLVATRIAVKVLADDGTIPITATCVDIDACGDIRTGIRFGGTGTAGQIIIVNNTGGDGIEFHNTVGTSLVRGIHADHDTMPANFVGMFVSDGTYWNLIAGGVDTQPDVGLTAAP